MHPIASLRRSFPFAVFCAFFLAAALSACTKSCSSSPQTADTQNHSNEESHATTAGGRPFSLAFDYKDTREVLISKDDPNTGDRWTARIVRGVPKAAKGSSNSEDPMRFIAQLTEEPWTIASGPNGAPLGDVWANGAFLLHVLDATRTMQLADATVSGPDESFGLSRPVFRLSWKVGESDNYAIELGAPAKSPDGKYLGYYGRISAPGYSSEDSHKVRAINGSFLEMLGRATSFDVLRLQTVVNFEADDVDEIEVRSADGKKLFYAERNGERWLGANKKTPVRADVPGFLEEITHLRIEKFFDEASKTPSLTTTYLIEFKNRKGTPALLRLGVKPGSGSAPQILASLSTRGTEESPSPVFEIYPRGLSAVLALLK